VSGSFLGYD